MDFGTELLTYMTTLSIAVTALTEVIKKTNVIPARFIPLMSVALGIFLGILASFLPGVSSLPEMMWAGGLAGLSGTGLFEQFTNRAKKYREDDNLE
ncbi:holin [Listeria monocytogenes]|uniref:holin n=1 Tax=Listeria monocytogenes TaxID=1639 RepID=UPI000775DCE4|nr:holin [Listeria monocytogenes]EAF5877634.1 holin [Listeria monocytogenes]EKZ4877813.1 holin [Listeria monocytogenes]KXS65741.1 holin [Listeria monocytogenes]KXW92896.1 holin [Listeria monocytogenes]